MFGALGAAAASLATTVGRSSPVSATDGDIVHVGHTYSATSPTEIDASGVDAFRGESDSGNGVYGSSVLGVGVYGASAATDQAAIHGQSAATGVRGYSGSGSPPATLVRTGVHGYANQDASAVGVVGQSGQGIGVFGRSLTGRGGVFYGSTAQLRLLPAKAKSHPTSGAAGDLFLDHAGDLWLCKGTTTWVVLG